ncbi:MAG TPA: NAD(P)H-dependent oxidoreductase [Bacteroidia bacterium]|nr:NAD(P)H-dependent oxidoreductase [Bacteroidia bacterium]
MYQLKVITASTRPSRKGPAVTNWILEMLKDESIFAVESLDLAQINLPFLDEPEHPDKRKYTKPHTFEWSAKIAPADAFIIVTPEYNFGYPAALKNALDFLYHEWNYKPVAFVSYGGGAGGTRAVQMLKIVANALKMVAITESVHLASFSKQITDGKFNAEAYQEKSAGKMIGELHRWTELMRSMRDAAPL